MSKKQFILIGHPVGHSISPSIHRAAYQELGIDADYRAVDCPDDAAVREQVQALRDGVIEGANVTVPHKHLAFELADHIHPTSARVGVANVLARDPHGKVVAHNTDASALADELRRGIDESGVEIMRRPYAVVLGNGGAAKAAVVACHLAGIPQVVVCARKFDVRVEQSSWPDAQAFLDLGAELVAWPNAQASGELGQVLSEAHLMVQATSAGMKGTTGGQELARALPWASFSRGVVYDLVYTPPVTPFLARAQSEGHHAIGGLGMLVGQARDAMGIWLGITPSRDLLMSVAKKELGL